MRRLPLLSLTLASVLALGCATARAQDTGGPPKHDKDPRDPVAAPEPTDAAAQKAKVQAVKKQMKEARERMHAAHEEVARFEREVAHLRDELEKEQAKGGAEKLENGRTAVEETLRQGELRLEEARRKMRDLEEHGQALHRKWAELGQRAGAPSDRPFERGGGTAHSFGESGPHWTPGPRAQPRGIEDRLAHLERAVREIHELFQRHGVGRDRWPQAEREVRGRGEHGRPPRGEDRWFGWGARGERPRPPAPRAGGPEMGEIREHADRLRQENAELRRMVEHMRKEMEEREAHIKRELDERERARRSDEMAQEMHELRRELDEAHREIERLRGEKR